MSQFSHLGSNLTPNQINTFKLSVSATCRKMTADQILDIADLLHDIIRKRGACCGSLEVATYDSCAAALAEAAPQ